jgi:GNAT superfamily N-acetyltransferase
VPAIATVAPSQQDSGAPRCRARVSLTAAGGVCYLASWRNRLGTGVPELRLPRNQTELAGIHDLRDTVLFKGRGRSGYDRHHPDDQSPNNHFMGFWQDGELVGTLRVDLLDDETAALRLVAVEPRLQGRGIGRKMIVAAEQFISAAGCHRVVTNAASDAVQFYSRLGYEEARWDDPGEGAGGPIVPMQKQLSPR